MSTPITAIILTLNEQEHLPGCLASLSALTKDVLVVDSGSSDDTTLIAHRHGARVVHRAFDGYANQRNAALEIPGIADWVVFIDADERLSTSAAIEIRTAIEDADDDTAVFKLPRLNLFFGRTLNGGGWWPDYQSRVIRRGHARYDPDHQIHERLLTNGESRYLRIPLTHLNYATWDEFHEKQRAYSQEIAFQRRLCGHVPSRKSYIGAPAREFYRRFFTSHGHRDRVLGFRLAIAMAREELWIRHQLRRTTRPRT